MLYRPLKDIHTVFGLRMVLKQAYPAALERSFHLKLDVLQHAASQQVICLLQTVLEQGGSFAGINRKVQVKPLKWSQPEEGSKVEPRVTEALLILKHGGVLTHAGRQQVSCSLPARSLVLHPDGASAAVGLSPVGFSSLFTVRLADIQQPQAESLHD